MAEWNTTADMGNFTIEPQNVSGIPGNRTIEEPNTPMYVLVLVTFFYILVFLFGLVGNGLVIFVVCRKTSMRNSTNLFLVNLSVADILVILVCMPTTLAEMYARDVWHLGEAMCKAVPYLENLVTHASILTILSISFERYYAICHPLKAQYTCTTRRTVKIIIVIWICACILTIPFALIAYLEPATFFDNSIVKVCRTTIESPLEQGYIVTLTCVFFVIPVIVLVILYSRIIRCLVVESKELSIESKNNCNNTLKQRLQVVYMLIAVIVLFFVCMLPFRVVSLWLIYSPGDVEKLGLEGFLNVIGFARVMYYMNSAGNPILYNVISSKFREAFKKALGIQRLSNSNSFRSLRVSVTKDTLV